MMGFGQKLQKISKATCLFQNLKKELVFTPKISAAYLMIDKLKIPLEGIFKLRRDLLQR